MTHKKEEYNATICQDKMIETGAMLVFGSMSVILVVTTAYLFWINRSVLFKYPRQ